jgi:beta-galactosidase
MEARYEEDVVRYPHRIIVGSETNPPAIAGNWTLVKKHPQIIGDFLWTGWDYIGEAGLGVPAYRFGEGGFGAQFPCQLAYCGDFDITGFRRPLSYFHEMIYGLTDTPCIAVQRPDKYGQPVMKTPWILSDSVSSWSYPGMEGKPVVVEVYAAGDEVELLLNGESLGRKPAGKAGGYYVLFDIVYQPGTLEAVSYENGEVIGKSCLTTADGPCHLMAEAEQPGTEEGLIYINIAKLAQNGTVAAHADEVISVTADDNVRILGFGSGDPKPVYNYNGTETKTYNGRALLVVQKQDCTKPAAVTLASDSGTVTLSI